MADTKDAIRMVARDYHTSTQEVLDNMEATLKEAYENDDPAVRAAWESLGFDACPTAEDFLEHIAEHIQEERQHRLLH